MRRTGKFSMVAAGWLLVLSTSTVLPASIIDVGGGDTFSYSWRPFSAGDDLNCDKSGVSYYQEASNAYYHPADANAEGAAIWHFETAAGSGKGVGPDATLDYRATLFSGGYVTSYWSTNGTDWHEILNVTNSSGVADPYYQGVKLSDYGYTGGSTDLYIKFALFNSSDPGQTQLCRNNGNSYGALSVGGSLVAVPEPVSLGLLAVGSLIGFRRRR